MRVISGSAKGYRLQCSRGLHTRPTADRVKEALFNILSFDIAGKSFLDLFSGSGSIAVEALSRGAREAVLVDNDQNAVRIIRDNLEKTGLAKNAHAFKMDVFAAISLLNSQNRGFDIVFLDPPYDTDMIEKTLEKLASSTILNNPCVIIAETDAGHEHSIAAPFRVFSERRYGNVKFIFMEWRQSDNDRNIPGQL